MLTEDHIVLHVDHVHDVVWVILLEEVENFEFYTGLIGVLFLVLHNFEGNLSLRLVVEAFHGLYHHTSVILCHLPFRRSPFLRIAGPRSDSRCGPS
jgi:hypothetical protein